MARLFRVLGLIICVSGLGLVLLLATSRFYLPIEIYPVQAAAEKVAPANLGIVPASTQELNGASTNHEPTVKLTVSRPDAMLFSAAVPEQNPIAESTASQISGLNKEKILTASSPETRNAITRLVIPDLRLDAEVKYVPFTGNTWELDDLGQSVAWLGNINRDINNRNLVLAGHATVFDGSHGPFRYLSRLTAGAQLIVYSEHFVYIYKVRELSLVEPEDAYIIEDTQDPQLTLLTCATWNDKIKSYLRRQVVIADLTEIEFISPEIMN